MQRVIEWYRSDSNFFLRSIFDQVGFKKRGDNEKPYFVVPSSLSSKIVYPVKGEIKTLISAKKDILREITGKNEGFSKEYLEGLSTNQLFFLLEKFGGSVPLIKRVRPLSLTCIRSEQRVRLFGQIENSWGTRTTC